MNRRRARKMKIRKIQTMVCCVLALVLLALAGWGINQHLDRNEGNAMAETENSVEIAAETTPETAAEATYAPENETDQSLNNETEAEEETLAADENTHEAAEATDGDTGEEMNGEPVPAPAPPMEEEILPLSGLIIGIDPGHQAKGDSSHETVSPDSTETKMKVSSGTQGISTRVPEYVVNLEVGLLLRDHLEALGAQVVMTRETHDINISNQERAILCNEAGADLVLRLHCNGAEDTSVKGISLFVRATGTGAEESLAAAEALMPAMLEATGARNFGIYRRDSYTGLNWSVPPSILVEMGFMSNPEEDELLCDPDYQLLLVEGMVQGVADYFGRELPEVTE